MRLLTLIAAALLALPGAADSLRLDNIVQRDVRITGIDNGRLLYQSSTGDALAMDLDPQAVLLIRALPAYGRAVEQIRSNPADAAAVLRNLLRGGDLTVDWQRQIVAARLVEALEDAGQPLEAAQEYAALALNGEARPERPSGVAPFFRVSAQDTL